LAPLIPALFGATHYYHTSAIGKRQWFRADNSRRADRIGYCSNIQSKVLKRRDIFFQIGF
jgi:hypothetical protein